MIERATVLLVACLILNAQWNLWNYQVAGERPPVDPFTFFLRTFLDAPVIVANSVIAAIENREVPSESDLPTIRLIVPPGTIEGLAANLPRSAKSKYYRARLLYPDDTWRKIKIRFRGRSHWHWHPEKPSLRLRLKKSDPISLQRHLNLISPEDRAMISVPWGEELARALGVLTHRTETVRVFLNKRFYGVYHKTTHEDESMLRLNRRMPGPLFRGNHLSPRWESKQFETRGETEILDRIKPLDMMVDAIYGNSGPDRLPRLWRIVDREKLARWFALTNLVGSTHTDYHHNHLYYFDPTTGLIEPMTEDIAGHAGNELNRPFLSALFGQIRETIVPLNERLTPLLDVALRDPRFLHRRNQVLYEALNTVGSVASQKAALGKLYAAQDRDVYADLHKAAYAWFDFEYFRYPYGNSQYEGAKEAVLEWIEQRDRYLRKNLKRVAVKLSIGPVRNKRRRVVVAVDGNSAVELDAASMPALIRADHGFDGSFAGRLLSRETLYPGLREVVIENDPDKENQSPRHYLRAAAQRYLIDLPAEAIAPLRGAFRHALTHKEIDVEAEYVDRIEPADIPYNQVSTHIWRLPRPVTDAIILGPGPVVLNKTLHVGSAQRLVLRPGTTLRLGPGVSIASRGKVEMIGSKQAPIRIERRDPKHPWGVIAIQGPGAEGSRLAHVHISGGSEARLFNIQYSGSLSVHWAGDFRFEDGSVSANVIGDDTIRVVHSRAHLARLELTDCHRDCVDFDYTDGEIRDVRIARAGNDGLDFMTSSVRVVNADIARIADKGVSAGEASTLTLDNIRIRGAQTGIAAKDGSRVKIAGAHLSKNTVAIDVFRKNWRYGGPGYVRAVDIKLVGNKTDVKVEKDAIADIEPGTAKLTSSGDGRVRLIN